MSAEGSLGALLRDTRELESFLHDFISQVTRRHPKPGEDVTRRAEELGLKVPAVLKGNPILWGGVESEQSDHPRTLVLVRPGNPEAIGLTIGCIRWGSVQICLECGWFYCRIVIKGTF